MKKRLYISYLISFLAPILIICYAMHVNEMNFDVIPGIGGDGMLAACLIKGIQDHGIIGAFFNEWLGAPGISTLIDTPFLDFELITEIYLLSLFIQSTCKILYLIYIVSYGLAGIAMMFLLNKMHIDNCVSVILSIIFAIAPYHFYRGIGHFTLSNYYTVPIGIYLAWYIFNNLYKQRKGRAESAWIAILSAIVGFGQLYYVFFLCVMMAFAILARIIQDRSIRVLRAGAMPLYVCFGSFLTGLLPKICYGFFAGSNSVAGVRVPVEAEIYGLKIVELLMPPSFSLFEKYLGLNTTYVSSGVQLSENVMSPLGLIGDFGFLIACFLIVYMLTDGKAKGDKFNILKYASINILILILYCTIGGFGTVFNYLISPQIRCYNRASIVIMCLALVVVGTCMDSLKTILLKGILSVFLIVIAFLDQVQMMPSGWQIPYQNYDTIYRKFFDEIENVTTVACEEPMVFELPFMSFPESVPINNMADYTPMLGYLYTDDIRWSYGGVIGRDVLAQNLYVDDGSSSCFVESIKAKGFDGVLIDTYGYLDGGQEVMAFYKELSSYELISDDGRFCFYLIV